MEPIDFAEDAGAGFEEATQAAYAIPFLYILQSNSPQVKKTEGAYVKGAEEGMFFLSTDSSLYPGQPGVVVVPVHFSQRAIEWKTREKGGGFVAEHPADTPLVQQTKMDEKQRNILPNGNQLVDTRIHAVLLLPDYPNCSRVIPAVINMTSTQLRKSRKWMSVMGGVHIPHPVTGQPVQAPMFARMYRLTTIPESNDKGSWWGFHVEQCGETSDHGAVTQARALGKAVRSGTVKVQHQEPESENKGASPSAPTDIGPDVPF
jgi:hypothetical protein